LDLPELLLTLASEYAGLSRIVQRPSSKLLLFLSNELCPWLPSSEAECGTDDDEEGETVDNTMEGDERSVSNEAILAVDGALDVN
jgi:hypothetical protein